MTIQTFEDGGKATLALEGRLDVKSAPQLQAELQKVLHRTTELVFDMQGVNYISSSGFRVLLLAQKQMNRQGKMRLIHVNDAVMQIIAITGFEEVFYVSR